MAAPKMLDGVSCKRGALARTSLYEGSPFFVSVVNEVVNVLVEA